MKTITRTISFTIDDEDDEKDVKFIGFVTTQTEDELHEALCQAIHEGSYGAIETLQYATQNIIHMEKE